MLLFVYGTLKRGFVNHSIIKNRAEFLGEAKTQERYPLFIAGEWNSPMLKDDPENGTYVSGELCKIDNLTLAVIDEFEGTGRQNGYYRKSILVLCKGFEINGAQVIEASTYFKHPEAIVSISAGPLSVFPSQNSYVSPSQRP